MAVSPTHPTALEVRGLRGSAAREARTARPTLRASDDGWSLIGADGELLFRGLGLRGRHECLEAARALGLPAVFS
jgi:hypothetical protein